MQIFEKWQHEQVVISLRKQITLFIKATTTCQPIVTQQHFNLIPLCHWPGWKVGCEIGKALCSGEASKKVQFLQPNNDDMMKKVYAVAQMYMNYTMLMSSLPSGLRLYFRLSKRDELAEEQICGSNQESSHSQ
jgi:hypothetical protein